MEFRVAMSTSVMLSSYVTIPLGSMGGSQETVRRELVRLMATLVMGQKVLHGGGINTAWRSLVYWLFPQIVDGKL